MSEGREEKGGKGRGEEWRMGRGWESSEKEETEN